MIRGNLSQARIEEATAILLIYGFEHSKSKKGLKEFARAFGSRLEGQSEGGFIIEIGTLTFEIDDEVKYDWGVKCYTGTFISWNNFELRHNFWWYAPRRFTPRGRLRWTQGLIVRL